MTCLLERQWKRERRRKAPQMLLNCTRSGATASAALCIFSARRLRSMASCMVSALRPSGAPAWAAQPVCAAVKAPEVHVLPQASSGVACSWVPGSAAPRRVSTPTGSHAVCARPRRPKSREGLSVRHFYLNSLATCSPFPGISRLRSLQSPDRWAEWKARD